MAGEPPRWLTRLGRSGWLVTGAVLGAVVLVVVASIVTPLLLPLGVAVMLAATLGPAVDGWCRHGVPRSVAAAAGALLVPAVVVCVVLLASHAAVGEAAAWDHAAGAAGDRLRDAFGGDPVAALDPAQWQAILLGVGSALAGGVSAAVQLVLGGLIGTYLLFFLLRDGARFAGLLAERSPLGPQRTRTLLSIGAVRFRRYLLGTTLVAAMDAVVITAGAALLRLPLLVTIAVVTFLGAYVPYLGAWVSALFAAFVALGARGVTDALWMSVIVLVTQNVLEGVVRPFVFGRTLRLSPLTILVVTIVGAALGGLVGVFLAPPVAAMIVAGRSALRADGPPPPAA